MTKEEAEAYYKAWMRWQTTWSWANILIGGSSVGLGALVAVNTKAEFLSPIWTIICAVAAPVLTFVLTTLKPQAEAASFKSAARELEKALATEADPSGAIVRGIDILSSRG